MTNKFKWIKPDNFLPPEDEEVLIELKDPRYWRCDVGILYIHTDIRGNATGAEFQTRAETIDINDVLWWSYIPEGGDDE